MDIKGSVSVATVKIDNSFYAVVMFNDTKEQRLFSDSNLSELYNTIIRSKIIFTFNDDLSLLKDRLETDINIPVYDIYHRYTENGGSQILALAYSLGVVNGMNMFFPAVSITRSITNNDLTMTVNYLNQLSSCISYLAQHIYDYGYIADALSVRKLIQMPNLWNQETPLTKLRFVQQDKPRKMITETSDRLSFVFRKNEEDIEATPVEFLKATISPVVFEKPPHDLVSALNSIFFNMRIGIGQVDEKGLIFNKPTRYCIKVEE